MQRLSYTLVLLLALLASPSITPTEAATATGKKKKKKPAVFRYNVCNGLGNQLLVHASAIATGISQKAIAIQIPDFFIVNGEQMTDDNVLPNSKNSVPFGQVFNQQVFQTRLESILKERHLQVRIEFVTQTEQLPKTCPGLSLLSGASIKFKSSPSIN